MKTFIFLVALAVSIPVSAADNICGSLESYARTVMEKRQQNVSVKDMMEAVSEGDNKELKDVLITVIKMAYEEPAYSGEEYQQKTVNEFANKVYLMCMK